MAGPWEKYAQPDGAPSDGPWAKYSPPPAPSPETPPAQTDAPISRTQHAAEVAGIFVRHPVTAMAGLLENTLSGITGGAGSLAEVVTGADPGTRDWAYRPRTQAGQEFAKAGADEAAAIGRGYDRVAGTGPLAQTLKERIPQAANAIGTVTGVAAIPKFGTALRAPKPAVAPTASGELGLTPEQMQRQYPSGLPDQGNISPQAPKSTTPKTSPEEARARDYVARNTALDWNSLSASVRTRLTEIARDSETLGKLDPQAVERQARLESLPVPIKATKGQLTRDTAQLTNEGTLASTEAGRPLKAIRDAQSQAIVDNLEVLKGKVRGKGATASTAETPEQVGLSVQDAALRTKLKLSQDNVKRLYKEAEAKGELQGAVPVKPLRDVISGSPDLTHLGWVKSWLEKTGKQPTRTLKELEDLRQSAVAQAMNGGTEGYYAGKVIRAIDEATDGAGGTAYKQARAARRAQALEFEDQTAVARLVENKSRTDRATALEDTWRKTVLGGSIEDVERVKRSLLTGTDANTRVAGRKAWRDIRAQTVQYIIDESTKVSATLPDGSPPVSAAGMQKAITAIGPQKMDAIFGPGTSKQIKTILQATKDVRTEPPRIHPGSSTAGNLVALLERGIGKVPGGDLVTGTIRTAAKIRDIGKTGREISEAQRTPLGPEPVNALTKAQKRNVIRESFIPRQETQR